MKKLTLLFLCAGKMLLANATIIPIEFEKDSPTFTSNTREILFRYSEELYLAKGIKVTLQEPSKNAEVKKQALFYKREKELKEFFKEEHLDFARISFTYEKEGNKGRPVINVEIVTTEVVATVTRPDSMFTNRNAMLIKCQPDDIDIANTLDYQALSSQEEIYNANVSSIFENKIILIQELLKIEFQSGKVPNKPIIAELPFSGVEKKSYLLLQWNNINREWSKTGTSIKVTSKKDKQFFTASIKESGIYALVDSKTVSVVPVTANAPKNVAITHIELVSIAPFVRIEGVISANQKVATFKGPKNHEGIIIRAVCQNASGKEWIEETYVKKKNALSIFRNRKKIYAYFNQ